jgi:SAM-dependent methyltransferase
VTVGPTERFTGRVADYACSRPSYPGELLDALAANVLSPAFTVADIGSGTGIFSRQLAGRVAAVICVEPNRGMRERSATFLRDLPNVAILGGTAEATGLPDARVDAVTAAQAFHWFDRERTKAEFRRILKPGGPVVLLWYERLTEGDPFLEGYEALIRRHAIDYLEVDHRNITPEVVAGFFSPSPVSRYDAMMAQRMDLEGLKGRIASSSYMPTEGHPDHAALVAGATELFNKCGRDGAVEFRYRTTAHVGTLPAPAGSR